MPKDVSDGEGLDPDRVYELTYLAFRWRYEGGTANLEKNLKRHGAQIVDVGKGTKLVRLKHLWGDDGPPQEGHPG